MSLDFSKYGIYGSSDKGRYRELNEDSFLIMAEDGCCFVADGVGGGSAGDVASSMVVDSLGLRMRETAGESPGERKWCVNEAIKAANFNISDYAKVKGYEVMASTVVGFVVDSWNSEKGFICHAGDSRVYLWRNGVLRQLSEDHTIENSLSKRERKKVDPKIGALLTKAIGINEHLEVDFCELFFKPNDVFILCSDGLSSFVEESVISEVVGRNIERSCLAKELVDVALRSDTRDNVTVVVVAVPEVLPDSVEVSQIDYDESEYLANSI